MISSLTFIFKLHFPSGDLTEDAIRLCCHLHRTPLHCAASCNNIDMVRLLVENGAAVFAKTIGDEETALNKCEEDDANCNTCFQYLTGM